MNKQEFIDRLRAALNGKIAPTLVAENVDFYEEYINVEIRKGKTEAEVLGALGDPRLIARTIVETNGGDGSNAYNSADYQDTSYQDAGYQSGGYRSDSYENADGRDYHGKSFHIPGWLWIIIVILVVVLIFSAIFSILSFLLPIVLPILLVLFFVKLFRDWLN